MAAALVALGLCAAPAVAAAGEPTGGVSPTPPAPAPASAPEASAPEARTAPGANLYGPRAPRIEGFACRVGCAGGASAPPGSLLRVRGRNLERVVEVIFLGAAGDGDDASVAPRAAGGRSLLARVPRTAVTGPLALATADGTRSPVGRRALAVDPLALGPPAGAIDAEVQGQKVFFGARRPAELSYVVGGTEPADVLVELIRVRDGVAIAEWTPGTVAPGVPQTIRWDGIVDGKVQREGVYEFRVRGTGARAASPRAPGVPEPPSAFTFLRHRFPVAGSHHYGEAGATFGGGRGHQGHDVFAACGTPVVAARGGVVEFKEFQSAAGNYVVIDGARTGVDFAYMHLRDAALVEEGERVRTGQPIGYVGATGRASGCHLHFEAWTAPGWYRGGRPFDPLPDLRAWDAQS